jgi:HK97 family phage portal protein
MSIRRRIANAFRALSHTSEVGWSRVNGSTPDEHLRTGREARKLGWEKNPVVNACVRAIADIMAAVDFEVYRQKSDGTAEVIEKHDAAILLNLEPRVGTSGHHLRAQTAVHYLLYGNSTMEMERGGRRKIQGVRLIHPEQIQQVEVNRDDQIEFYKWRDIGGRAHRSPAEDMLHFKDLTATEDGLFGYPRAAAALQDISSDYEATQYVRQVVTNHGVPGLMVRTRGFKNRDDMLAAEEQFNQKMLSRGGRGSALFIQAEEAEFEQLGFNLAELEFPSLRQIAREDICAVFHVDPRMVGFASATGKEGGLSGVQFREARFKLIQQAVMPVMKSFEAELNRWYMPEWGDLYIRFNPDTLSEMTEDETATSTRVIAEAQAGIRTLEESRETVGLTADIDPSHHMVTGGTITTVSIAMAEADKDPAEQAKELADAQPKPEGPPTRSTPVVRDEVAQLHRLSSGTDEFVAEEIARLTPDTRTARWHAFEVRATREESTFLRVVNLLFQYEQSRVSALLRSEQVASQHVVEQMLRELAGLYASDGEVYQRWVGDMSTAIRDVLSRGIENQVGVDFSIENPRAQSAIRRRTNKLTGHVTDTTYEQIRGLVLLGREQGLTVREVADQINQVVFDGNAPARARMIAQTETIGALNEGAYLGASEGGMRSKSWLSQRDERVRETHTHAEGEGWIPLTRAFGNGLQYPGDQNGHAEEVINCRCTLLFSDEEQP